MDEIQFRTTRLLPSPEEGGMQMYMIIVLTKFRDTNRFCFSYLWVPNYICKYTSFEMLNLLIEHEQVIYKSL